MYSAGSVLACWRRQDYACLWLPCEYTWTSICLSVEFTTGFTLKPQHSFTFLSLHVWRFMGLHWNVGLRVNFLTSMKLTNKMLLLWSTEPNHIWAKSTLPDVTPKVKFGGFTKQLHALLYKHILRMWNNSRIAAVDTSRRHLLNQ